MSDDYQQIINQQAINLQSRSIAEVMAEQQARESARAESLKQVPSMEATSQSSGTFTSTVSKPTEEYQLLTKEINKLNKALDKASPKAEEIILKRLGELEDARENLVKTGLAYYNVADYGSKLPNQQATTTLPSYVPSFAPSQQYPNASVSFIEIPADSSQTQANVFQFGQDAIIGSKPKLIGTVDFTTLQAQSTQPVVQTQTIKEQVAQDMANLTTDRIYNPSETMTNQQNINTQLINPSQSSFIIAQTEAIQSQQQGQAKLLEAQQRFEQSLLSEKQGGALLKAEPYIAGATLFGLGVVQGIKTAPEFVSPIQYTGENFGKPQVPIIQPLIKFGGYLASGQYVGDVISSPLGTAGQLTGQYVVLGSTPVKEIIGVESKGIYEASRIVGEGYRQAQRNVNTVGVPTMKDFFKTVYDVNERPALEYAGERVPSKNVIDINIERKPSPNEVTIYEGSFRKTGTIPETATTGQSIIPRTGIETIYKEPLLITKDLNFYDLESLSQANKNIPVSIDKGITFAEAREQARAENFITVPKYDSLGNPIPYNSRFLQDSPNPQNYLIPLEDYNKYLRRTKANLPLSEEANILAEKSRTESIKLFQERTGLKEEQLKEKLNVVRVPKYDSLGNEIPYETNFKFETSNPKSIEIPQADYNKYLRRRGAEGIIREEQAQLESNKSIFDNQLSKERATLREEQLKEKLDVVRLERYDSLGNEIPYPTNNKFIVNERFVEIPRADYNKYLRRSTPRQSYESVMSNLVATEKAKAKIYESQLSIERKQLREEQKFGNKVAVPIRDSLGNLIDYGTKQVIKVNEQTQYIPERAYNKYIRRTTPKTKPLDTLPTNLISGLIEVKTSENTPSRLFTKVEEPKQSTISKEKEVESPTGTVTILKEPVQVGKGRLKKKATTVSEPLEPSKTFTTSGIVQETSLAIYESGSPSGTARVSDFSGQKSYGNFDTVQPSMIRQNFAPAVQNVQVSIPLLGVKNEQNLITQPIPRTSTESKISQTTIQELRQEQFQESRQSIIQDLSQKEKLDTSFIQSLEPIQSTQQKQRTELRFDTKIDTPQDIIRRPQEEYSKPNIFVERERDKKKGKFTARVKSKGKFVSVGTFETPEEAFSTGRKKVEQSLKASFDVIGERGERISGGILPSNLRMSKATPNVFVQKEGQRLSSQQERIDIQSARKSKGIFG